MAGTGLISTPDNVSDTKHVSEGALLLILPKLPWYQPHFIVLDMQGSSFHCLVAKKDFTGCDQDLPGYSWLHKP
jgi:hypothetical protein